MLSCIKKQLNKDILITQNNLGICYQNGTGVEKNFQKAFELYQKATEQGSALAQCNLGICYQNGIGVKKNTQKAVELYQKAAEKDMLQD